MNNAPARPFLTGIVEGFYGRSWPHETRLLYADYLSSSGLNTCLYCPKSDPYLRKQWQQDWPQSQWDELCQLSRVYRDRGLYWGVGLSPFALYRHYGPAQRDQLRAKMERLAGLNAPLLAILFDDMPGDVEALADRQAEIVADVASWLPGMRLLVCPTYYSFDPVLQTHFGAMPADYWPRLGRCLPPGVDIFWTGSKVCSEAITRSDIGAINELLKRPVMLWDNYPVNDGALRSNFLYLDELSGRDSLPPEMISGHLCNPMNQGTLSLPALLGLARLYSGEAGNDDLLKKTIGAATWQQLQSDRVAFTELGLSGMGETHCRELAMRYRSLPGPAAGEVAGWLLGEYRFDPACLTD
jgi:hypothetical protein